MTNHKLSSLPLKTSTGMPASNVCLLPPPAACQACGAAAIAGCQTFVSASARLPLPAACQTCGAAAIAGCQTFVLAPAGCLPLLPVKSRRSSYFWLSDVCLSICPVASPCCLSNLRRSSHCWLSDVCLSSFKSSSPHFPPLFPARQHHSARHCEQHWLLICCLLDFALVSPAPTTASYLGFSPAPALAFASASLLLMLLFSKIRILVCVYQLLLLLRVTL